MKNVRDAEEVKRLLHHIHVKGQQPTPRTLERLERDGFNI